VGQPEDRAIRGRNPSAELEAGAGEGVTHALPPFACSVSLPHPLDCENPNQPRHKAVNPGDLKPSMG
jgi:hypothetical protein